MSGDFSKPGKTNWSVYAHRLLRRFSVESNEYVATISFIISWDFLMYYQTLLLPQVKRWAIITYKHGIYELPHELPNDLDLGS